MSDQSIIRISKEIGDVQRDSDLSIAVACKDIDVRNVVALIVGPPDTPYEFGFFEFNVKFPNDYPTKGPAVIATTTNGGRTRFNPNIYSSGRVCLSILGTWRGERGEEWSAAQGLESILLSIQSLMSSNPYENEPGFEGANSPEDKENQEEYAEKIRHETLRISVILRLERYLGIARPVLLSGPSPKLSVTPFEPPQDNAQDDKTAAKDCPEKAAGKGVVPFEPFQDLCKQRFLWYYDAYVDSARKGEQKIGAKRPFKYMPFEAGSNMMEGSFNYANLESRLETIKSWLDRETAAWASEGKTKAAEGSTVAVNLKHQFEQMVLQYKASGLPHNIELEDGNPFVWIVTYFGKPMTNLDGGLFRFRVCISPNFPHDQPRIRLETKIFHHRVAKDGTACYSVAPSKREEIRSHINAVIDALEEENPAYDPRTMVHPEAHKLLWGSAEDRKMYSRRLRRSVQQSMEEF